VSGCEPVRLIESPYGHDAFLVETRRLEQIFAEVLER
jgi:homoserine acetyltransferase